MEPLGQLARVPERPSSPVPWSTCSVSWRTSGRRENSMQIRRNVAGHCRFADPLRPPVPGASIRSDLLPQER